MKLNPIAANQTEVELSSGVMVFFSYKTPVAAHIPGKGYVRTDQHYSQTTSGHIPKWLALRTGMFKGNGAETVPQSEIDALV